MGAATVCLASKQATEIISEVLTGRRPREGEDGTLTLASPSALDAHKGGDNARPTRSSLPLLEVSRESCFISVNEDAHRVHLCPRC